MCLHKSTSLHLAAQNGHHETVPALLAAGADVNAQNSQVRRRSVVVQDMFM